MSSISVKYGYFCISLVLCIYYGYTQSSTKDPVDFTVVNDSSLNHVKKSSDGLPKDVDINFNVLGRPMRLHLTRNPKLRNVHGVFTLKRSKTGIPVVIQQDLQRYEVFGEYQDPNHKAIFTISCPKSKTNQTCDAVMEGTFRAGQKEFRMKLMDDHGLHRMRREASRLWSKAKNIVLAADAMSKVYGIYETDSSTATPTDYKDAGPMLSGKVAAAFGRSAKIVRDDILPGGQEYNLEVLVLLDYGIYQRFYKSSQGRTEKERENNAKINIQKYFSHVFNGVDMMYKGIDDSNFGISVAVSGFVIADSPDTSPWSTPLVNPVRDGRDELLVNEALDALIRWSFSARNVPENDHIMLITDYDLYSLDGGSKDLRTAGYARVASVCSLDSVSLIEDHGGFQSINAAAHELGHRYGTKKLITLYEYAKRIHTLGARHDGNANACDPKDQYIMTAHGGFESETTKTNPWKFSKCSVEYFKNYVTNLRRSCLRDPVDVYDVEQFTDFLSNYPGQMLTPNEQCQDILGLESYYGWGRELGTYSDICTAMSCAIPGSSRSFRIFKAATGTSCGDKMWCQTGQCVFDERAPTKNPTCVFGDMQRRFRNNKSCREYMLERPSLCYDAFYKSRCCDTCEKLNTGVKNCEYGDKYVNCNSNGCFDRAYRQQCCSTCGLAPPPVLRATPTTTTTTARPPPTRPPRIPTTVKTFRVTTKRPFVVTRPPRPTTRRPPAWRPQQTTRKPLKKVTDSNVIAEKPKKSNLRPSGKRGLCLRLDDRFLLVFTCSSLMNLFGRDACDNSLISRYCCEKCPPPAPSEKPCKDKPSCKMEHPRDCYVTQTKDECCGSCKKAETNIKGCEYGDRIRSCERYVGGLGPTVVCGKYAKYCCGMCSVLQPNNTGSRSIEKNQIVSDVIVGDNLPSGPDITDLPSTFLSRDWDGNVVIVGTGRDKGASAKKKNRQNKRKNRKQNKKQMRKQNNKQTRKQNNLRHNRKDKRNRNRIVPPGNVINARRGTERQISPVQTIMFTSGPNQRRRDRPLGRMDPARNFRIVFTGK